MRSLCDFTDLEKKIPLLVIVGPTASGKTELAARLARTFSGEVVSADSMQVYRNMPIATAVPTPEERLGVPHHLLEFLDPGEPFSVASYVALAHSTIADIYGRGRLPVLAGGTGLYISSVLENLEFPSHRQDPQLRSRLQEQAKREGPEAMHRRLSEIDPESAGRIHPSNLGRVLRAIEIYELSGIPMTEHLRRSRQTPSPYRPLILGINFADRQRLYDRINLRVDLMLEQGLLEEAKRFCGGSAGPTAAQAIGHKELCRYLNGQCTLPEAVELLKRETRRYAKRQITWFSRIPEVRWILRDCLEDWTGEARRIVQESNLWKILPN